MLGILVGTAALIIVLSVFNGLEGLVRGFYQSFDPDLKASLVKGKYYTVDQDELDKLRGLKGVVQVAEVLEDRVLYTYRNKEHIASIKGVSPNFHRVSDVKNSLVAGDYFTRKGSVPTAIIGAGVSYYLGYGSDFQSPISVFVPREKSGLDFSTAFSSELLYPSGIFSIEPEFDEKYAITDLSFVRKLLGRPNVVTAFEIKLNENADVVVVKDQVKQLFGNNFKVQNRDEQQEVLFKVMKSENLFTFLVFALILGISTFTIMGSLTMLMLDKRENIFTLWALGSDIQALQKLFFKEGMIIGLAGATFGLIIGVGVVLLQKHFGIIGLAPGYAIDAYPVDLRLKDILLVTVTVVLLCGLASWLTSKRLSLKMIKKSIV